MHPAYSVIVFTTVSGAGYGLVFWTAVLSAAGMLPVSGWACFWAIAAGLALAAAGLLASLFHLGHPERSLRAFSQWRSSWLSREGVVAVASFAPAGILALLLLPADPDWMAALLAACSGENELPFILCLWGWIAMSMALLAAALAALTVYCTGMIYASLRTIRQWNRRLVPAAYLAISAGTGGILLCFSLSVFGQVPASAVWCAMAGLASGAAVKLRYWKAIDSAPGRYTAEAATGLSDFGEVRQLDPPHTMPNFVMREMGYSVARKHARRLRMFAFASLFAAPALLLASGLLTGFETAAYALAIMFAAAGVLTERWLFFAEAEHVSQLYYGRSKA